VRSNPTVLFNVQRVWRTAETFRSRPGEKVVDVKPVGVDRPRLRVQSFQQSGVLETLDGILLRQLTQLALN